MSATDAIDSTPEWLKEDLFVDILREEFNEFVKIKTFNIEPAVKTGENYMMVLLRVSIEIQLADGTTATTTYIVKTPPSTGPMVQLLTDWKVFEKEQGVYNNYLAAFEQIYREVGSELRFGPKLLHVKQEIMDSKNFLIMEDLCVQHFHNAKRQNGLNIEQTKAVLRKLAQFHAASACYFVQHGPYPAMYAQCLYSTEDTFAEFRYKQCKQFRDCLAHYNGAQHLNEKIKIYRQAMPDMYQAHSPINPNEFQVLNHGDCWMNNFMFQYDDADNIKDICFIDFQLSRYGSPAHDLYYFLLTSTHVDIKLKEFDYFIFYYHQQLIANLKLLNYNKKLPSLRELHIALFEHGDWAFTIALNVLPLALLDPSEDAKMDNILAETDTGLDLKNKMFSNKRYMQHMSILLPWMDNRGLLEATN